MSNNCDDKIGKLLITGKQNINISFDSNVKKQKEQANIKLGKAQSLDQSSQKAMHPNQTFTVQ